jgi:glucosyl-dolichyl phosphate glucuronosyltransferase
MTRNSSVTNSTRITVIICTYNRARGLAKALESVAASELPTSVEWDVLVVDNNSSDQTRQVVEDFCHRYPSRFGYSFEPQQGLCNARNAGILKARGEILAFMDDDVTVEPTWLQNLTAPLHGGEWAGAGGRTLPSLTCSLPPWLAIEEPYNLGGALAALFDIGDKSVELDRSPYGTNMAFRKSVFKKYGGFRSDLDRCADSLLSNGDTEFGRRLMAAGERLRYEPSAVVYHEVPEKRLHKQYFLAWYFAYGRCLIRESGRRPDIWRIPRRYLTISKTIKAVLVPRMLRWMLALNPQRRFFYKCWVWVAAGEILEIHRQWRGARTQIDEKGRERNADCRARN